jgi:hypothetical protein
MIAAGAVRAGRMVMAETMQKSGRLRGKAAIVTGAARGMAALRKNKPIIVAAPR